MRPAICILDFGSQYTQLIARRIRELKVYCEIHPYHLPVGRIREMAPQGLIFSGGPASCYVEGAPRVSPELFSLDVPKLGICYGVQVTVEQLGGRVVAARHREYGPADMTVVEDSELFFGFPKHEPFRVWMSHGDVVEALPEGMSMIGTSPSSPLCAVQDRARKFYGLQFHPEVEHTPRGSQILSNFVFRIAGCKPTWTMASFVEEATAKIRTQMGDRSHAVCGLSGGVDSAVAAALVNRASPGRLSCIFVDNGLLRTGEVDTVRTVFEGAFGLDLHVADAEARFMKCLAGVTDPELKRKRIGAEFVAVFEEEAKKIEDASFLVQGTLYPDVIESQSVLGPSAIIKSHHNVGGLPEKMHLKLIEPLRELFKDEVRQLGAELGLPRNLLWRQPFPGPGLAVRIVGEVNAERCHLLRKADAIVDEEIRNAGLYESLWQSFAVLLPVRSVGVMGDARTYGNVLAIRAVTSVDGMTADWARLPHDLLGVLSSRIINEVPGIGRVVYDISSKPPTTIEWE